MERESFIENLENVTTPYDKREIMKTITDSVNSNINDENPRGHKNLIIVMEELCELGQAISKEIRGKGDSINLLEELADVQLSVFYIQEICNISDDKLKKAQVIKTDRLRKKLEEDGIYL